MKVRSGPLAYLLYLLIRSALALLQIFPVERNLGTAQWFACIWARLMPRHRQRALAHLVQSLGQCYSARERSALADRCLAQWTMFAIELMYTARLITAFSWHRYVRLVNFDEVLDLALQGRGLILVTGHYGQFELPGHLLACLGFEVAAVMRPLDNVYLNDHVVRTRATHGLRLLDKKGALQSAENLLRTGALLGFIADQDAGRKGVFVEFFGRPASTYKSIALLAMKTRSPIVVGYARRRGSRFQYDVGVQRIIRPEEWDEQADPVFWITQTYTAAIEAFVRDVPEQYLWIHRRWKTAPSVRMTCADATVRESGKAAGSAAGSREAGASAP
ncbi:MAG TPA: lysophospholipid acyltransferase family protein [Phycisphaerae bacterium]|nr:lysophospholipid acyltransferase family protein [Phycisphaerae bacterium]HNU44397.1 lysophospholipid acyltransferase family protein [Phycisphaerae bacterium]